MTDDRFGCRSTTIKVAAGHYVDLANPSPESIDIRTIAAALSKLCRFGGHAPVFYSVAEHSIHATQLAASDGLSRKALQAIFLHDAAEAYVGDMVRPLKAMVPEFHAIEKRIADAIALAFGVDFDVWAHAIACYDRAMLKAEKMALWPDDTEEWEGFRSIESRKVALDFHTSTDAEARFLRVAMNLGLAKG